MKVDADQAKEIEELAKVHGRPAQELLNELVRGELSKLKVAQQGSQAGTECSDEPKAEDQ